MAGPPHKLIVHFMRHCEALHKVTKKVDDTLEDPDLSPTGRRQCTTFAKKFDGQELYITHIIASPMSRTLSTARLAFKGVMKLPHNSGLSIMAVPQPQNFDQGPNGTGRSANELAKKYGGFKQIDAESLITEGWNLKTSGKWSEGEWRIHHVKGHLNGVWVGAGAGTKHVEVVVVSHSSFFRKLFEGGRIRVKEGVLTHCILNDEGNFEEISSDELRRLRAQ